METLNEFLRYWYAYYLTGMTLGNERARAAVNPAICVVMERLIESTDGLQPAFRPRPPFKSRYFFPEQVLVLDRSEIQPGQSASWDVLERFWNTFPRGRQMYQLTSTFPLSQTTFHDWRFGKLIARPSQLRKDVLRETSYGQKLVDNDFRYRGAILTAIEPKTLLVYVGDAVEITNKLTRDSEGKRTTIPGTGFSMDERATFIRSRIQDNRLLTPPRYWMGADVTSLIDVDSYLLHPHAQSKVRAPQSARLFDAAVNAVTNPVGIHCLSLYQFPLPAYRTPVMRLWKELADQWDELGIVPSGNRDQTFQQEPEPLIQSALPFFGWDYPRRRFAPLMQWLRVQIDDRNSVRIFANDKNTDREIELAWRYVSRTKAGRDLADYAEKLAFNIEGNDRAKRLNPGQYAASYAMWSFAKATPYIAWAPKKIDYLTSWQRLDRKTAERGVPLSKEHAGLFPWGPILRSVLDALGICDGDWLYFILGDLRRYTVKKLDSLCTAMVERARSSARSRFDTRTWLEYTSSQIQEFIACGLLEHIQADLVRREEVGVGTSMTSLGILKEVIQANRDVLYRFLIFHGVEKPRLIRRKVDNAYYRGEGYKN